MERELWRRLAWALRRLPRTRPRGGVYSNTEVLAVLLWAALHDRSILWACRRAHWPMQAWRRRLPDQSTMSRRLRDPALLRDMDLLVRLLQGPAELSPATLIVDGKPLPVSEMSGDRDAVTGWGAGRFSRGYKLHALIDRSRRLLAWEVRPMNQAESVVARDLLAAASAAGLVPRGATLLGDASYDSNPLHATAGALGLRLIAPRRKARRSISPGHRQHPGRLASIALTESPAWRAGSTRAAIERFFGGLASPGGGLHALPPWARRASRVRVWVGAKLVINAARRPVPRRAVA